MMRRNEQKKGANRKGYRLFCVVQRFEEEEEWQLYIGSEIHYMRN